MYAGRRIAAIRVTALAALAVSAILYADSLHPGRAFCPMAAACDKARSSALGRIFGVPTSVLGMAAFGGLFLFTMLRVELSRKLLRPAGFMAALVGAGLFGYQAVVIKSFCPLCLVADTAGLVAGLIVLTWPATPVRRSGKKLTPESMVARLRWMTATMLVVAAPFLWPRPEKPAWVELPAGSEAASSESADDPQAAVATTVGDAETGRDPVAGMPKKPARGAYEPEPEPTDAGPGDRLPAPPPTRPTTAALPTPTPAASIPPPPRPVPRPAPMAPPPPPPRAALTIVEYLNAFCSHCRATHQRLETVLAAEGVEVRRRRIYTWASNDTPMWAKVVAFAQTLGLEDRMFAELVRADEETPREIYAAASRAGLDVDALRRALSDDRAWPRLEADRRLAQGARLEGLPTLDIGRRRLMGEQSEEELREAVRAAMPRAEPSR
jgi:predicted DsbA family dithiol-disulfide isomerase/uncharacterized membrane protein